MCEGVFFMSEEYEEEKPIEYSGITPADIGKKLRKAREAQNLTIEDLQKQTKLRTKYIKSIEKGDFSVFPGDVYAKGAIRNYAEVVGLDFMELWEDYESVYQQESEQEDNSNEEQKDKEVSFLNSFSDKFIAILPVLVKFVAIVLVIGIIGYGVYWGYDYLAGIELNGDEIEEEATTPEKEETEDEDHEEQDEEQDQEVKEEPKLPSIERTSDNPITYTVIELEDEYEIEDEIEVILEIGEQEQGCWVGATIDGEFNDLGTMDRETSETLHFQESIEFTLGRPVNASITVFDTELEIPETTSPEDIIIELDEDEN